LLMLATGLLGSLATSVCAHGVVQDNYERLEQIANMIRDGDLTSADRELRQILRAQPSDPNALNLLGVIRVKQQQPAEAEKLFLNAVHHSPRLVGGYVNLGRLYQDQHKVERAQWAYGEANKLSPDNPEVIYQLASLSIDQRDFPRALLYLQRIPESSWRVKEYYIAINSYLNLSQPEKALGLIAHVEQQHWLDDEAAAAAFSSLLMQTKQQSRAIAIIEKGLEKNPNSLSLLHQLGSAYESIKQWTQAEKAFAA